MKKKDRFELMFPIPRTHCGIVMGNGNFGAVVWGVENLHVTVNRADFWDHRGGEVLIEGTTYKKLIEAADTNDRNKISNAFIRKEFPENVFKPQRLPVGRFEFILTKGLALRKAVLEYQTGDVFVFTATGEMLELTLGIKDNLLVIKDKSEIIKDVLIRPSWDFEKSREWLAKYAFVPPEKINEGPLTGWIQSCPDDPALASICVKKPAEYIISLEFGENSAKARSAAVENVNRMENSREAFSKGNHKWWRRFWRDIPEIKLPDEFFNRFYKSALYKFASATSPESPIPCGLQGPWVEEYQNTPWGGWYVFDLNVQQIYTFGLGIGKLDHLMPLFDMVESAPFMNNMRHNAKVLLGIDDGLLLTHAVDERGGQAGWLSTGSVLAFSCGGWLALLYWFYYKYSHDREFLEKRAYPFILGIMRVYEEILEEYDGRLSIPMASSPEYGSSNRDIKPVGRDPSVELACIHALLNALFEAAKILNIPPKQKWIEIKEKLPPYTLIEGVDQYLEKGQRIAIWKGQDLEASHRHHSHLACIYPFDSLEQLSPESIEILDNTIDHWIKKGMGLWSEWCIPWAAIIHTRMGLNESPAVLLNMWREIFINEGMTTVYLPRFRGITSHRRRDMLNPKETSEIMQLDGTMGTATALLEMLAHTHSGHTRVFAGIPEKWRDVSFSKICLPDGFIVSAEKKDGVPQYVKIHGKFGGAMRLTVSGISAMKLIQNTRETTVNFPVNITLAPAETIELIPNCNQYNTMSS